MKIVRRLLVLVIVIGVVAGGAYWYNKNQVKAAASSTASQTYSQTVAVKQGNLSSTVTVVGQVEATQSAGLAFERMNGTTKLLSLAVKAGTTVTTGQVLATIDATAYQAALDQAKSALQASQKTLADLTTPATTLAIAKADLAIAKAQLQVQQAQNTLSDLVNPDIAKLQLAVASAESGLSKAQADVVAQQQSQSYKDQLYRLQNAEATPTTTYNRLAAENTPSSDAFYVDRLEIAYNKMMDAHDARVSYETSAQVSAVQAQVSLRKAQTTLAAAQDTLATAQAGGDPMKVASAKVGVNEAQLGLQTAQKAKADLVTGADATTVATAKADVDKKKVAVSDAEAALAGTKLVASFDGTVLKTNVSAGDQVGSNTVILTVANLKTLQVAASVDETTIKRVSAGQDATITFDAFAGQTFTGKVQSVPLQGSLQGGVTVYVVPVSLVGADKVTLLVGMTANVKIQAGSVTNALLVPTMALTKANGQYQVLVPNTTDPAGAPETVTVQVGLSDGTYTQITKGLNVGDQVIMQVKSTTTTTGNQQQGPGGFDMPAGGFPAGPPGGN